MPWWARPATVLPGVAGLALLAALFTPVESGARSGDPRISTLSDGPLGASLLHELAGRLGWTPERRLRSGIPEDTLAIIAVLDPVLPLRSTEVHALLEHVRAGGRALVVASTRQDNFLDSLHLKVGPSGTMLPVESKLRSCATGKVDARYTSLWFGDEAYMLTLQWTAPRPGELRTFVSATVESAKDQKVARPTMVGFDYGAGRMVVSVDGDVFRNDAMRQCALGLDVAAVRALEFLRDGGDAPRTRLVFDEYHQAHGAHPGSISAAVLFLGTSPSGRLLAQLALAGLLLLIALAPRTIAPRAETRVERRSPLEQVDALARAYAQVRATRTAAERLVHGARRRCERGLLRDRAPLSDDAWLERVGTRHPALRDDVALLRRALAEPLPPRTFATLGPALHRVEQTLTRS